MKHYISICRAALVAILLSGFAASLVAQNVTVTILPPPLNQVKIADLWKISLINNGSSPVEIMLHGTVTEESDGLIADATSSRLTATVGVVNILGSTLEPIDVDYADIRYRDALVRTGGVPSGEYELCVEVLEAETGEVLSEDCIFQTVDLLSPPDLIFPPDDGVVNSRDTDFSFVTRLMEDRGVRYQVKIVQMLGRQSPEEALRANRAFFTNVIDQQTFRYPLSAKNFEAGRYAWVVIAEKGGKPLIASEPSTFTYQPLAEPIAIGPGIFKAPPGPISQALRNELLSPCSGGGGFQIIDRFKMKTTMKTVNIELFQINN